jgi:hypothetical protein
MLGTLLARIFPAKQPACCGVEIIRDEVAVPRIEVGNTGCGRARLAAKRSTHIPLVPVVYATNAFLIRRAEMLRGMPGNPYDVQIKHHGLVTGILVGRAPTPALNRVFGANLEDSSLVSEFDAWFAQTRATPAYQVLEPSEQATTPPPGFAKVPGWDHVILEKDELDPDREGDGKIDVTADLQVERITRQGAETFIQIYAQAFDYPSSIVQPLCRSVELLIGQPDVYSYVVKASGEPVAVGQLFLSEYGAAFLGSTGTLPAARRLGCQLLLDHQRLLDAHAAGYRQLCRTVALNSQSWRNSLRGGYRAIYHEAVYAPPRNVVQPKASRAGCCTVEFNRNS